ncbi:MAG: hypothetical protein PHI31_00895 [Desulfuromonadaceae bacterium]|nr:hypothetical protein [Desulfuromonadaceae bacterium]
MNDAHMLRLLVGAFSAIVTVISAAFIVYVKLVSRNDRSLSMQTTPDEDRAAHQRLQNRQTDPQW